jgi:hypothetical protein
MKVRGLISRCNIVLLCFVCFSFLFAPCARAQTVPSISGAPSALSFGVPTGTTPPTSSSSTVVVSVYASVASPVTFGTAAVSGGSNPNDFQIQGDSCSGNTFSTVTSCQVSVIFTSTEPAGTLETATLSIPTTTANSLAVNLSGAYGAIKLWSSTPVLQSVQSASITNLYTIASASLNLSCPASPVATLSNRPDGSGNVMVDNYITLAINNAPVNTYLGSISSNPNNLFGYSALYPNQAGEGGTLAYPLGNICQNSDAYPDTDAAGHTYPECFSAAYRSYIGTHASNVLGVDTDSITNANNLLPAVNGNTAGGVTALGTASGPGFDLGTNFFAPNLSETGTVQASFQALDAGSYYETSTLFLVTNCSQAGVVPGGTVTGTTVTPSTPISTGVFDSSPNQNMSVTINNTGATNPATNANPQFTDYGITQPQFQQLVSSTSAGPAACLLISGEVNPTNNQLMCKGFQVQCYNANPADPNFGKTGGDYCGTSTTRNLFDSVQFSSPDTPLPATISNTFITSCQSFVAATTNPSVTNGTCVTSNPPSLNPSTLIGPGFLLFGDGIVSKCTYNADSCPLGYTVNTTAGSCALTGGLANNLCPLNTLTSFLGAADGAPGGSSVPSRNSIYVPVMNMALPFTTVCTTWISCAATPTTPTTVNTNGWANSTNVTINFQSNAATYSPSTGNPSSNGWTAAAPYSLSYLLLPASQPIPDPTYPPSGATSNFNPASGVNQNYSASPICPTGLATTPFATTASFSGLTDGGLYNLPYFTTACDYSEELYFNPSSSQLSNAAANWASLPVLPFGVDVDAPLIKCPAAQGSAPPVNVSGTIWYGGTVTLTCTASDMGLSGIWKINGATQTLQPLSTGNVGYGGFVSTVQQGPATPPSYNVSAVGTPGAVTLAVPIAQQTATDAAGNTAIFAATSYNIDMQAPSITGPAFTLSGKPVSPPFIAGQGTITITYSCSDGTGSGVNSCTDAASSLPSGTTSPSCSTTSGVVTCTSTFAPTTSNVGSYQVTVNSADYVGNMAKSSVPFSIGYAPATVNIGALAVPLVALPGKPLAILVGAADVSPASNPVSVYGATITVQLQMPSSVLGGSVTAAYADITCTTLPCTIAPSRGSACSVGTGTVNGTTTVSISCPVGTIGDFYTNKTGVVVNIGLPISSKAPTGSSIKGVANIVSNQTPLSGNTSYSGSVLVF